MAELSSGAIVLTPEPPDLYYISQISRPVSAEGPLGTIAGIPEPTETEIKSFESEQRPGGRRTRGELRGEVVIVPCD